MTVSFIDARRATFGGCGTDWGEEQKCRRERLQARDNSILHALHRMQCVSSCLRIYVQLSSFPPRLGELFRPHYVCWPEQQKIERH